MGVLSIPVEAASVSALDDWLSRIRAEIDKILDRVIASSEEAFLDRRWAGPLKRTRLYATRPSKRLRPALLLTGFGLGANSNELPPGLWQFAAGVELLHTFMLIHDDVADCAEIRRGGSSLHHVLAPGKQGEDLAVVMGDYLFARSIDVMLASGLARAVKTVQYYLRVCRKTAVGQYLDLELTRVPLHEVTLFQVLKVANLKTAEPSFIAPLMAGGLLAGAASVVIRMLVSVGRQLGLSFQLRDDLLGLFGEQDVAGKPCDLDLTQGKRTFPVIAAYVRAPYRVKREFEALWAGGITRDGSLRRAQELVEVYGGRAATEQAVARMSCAARRALKGFPADNPLRGHLDELIDMLSRRDY